MCICKLGSKVFPWEKIGRTRAEGERIAPATMVERTQGWVLSSSVAGYYIHILHLDLKSS